MKRFAVLVLALVLSVTAAACGKNSNSPSVFTDRQTGTVSAFGTTRHALTVTRTGNMTLTLTWNTNSDLDLYLGPSSCQTTTCNFLAVSDASSGRSEEIKRSVSSGETFAIFVDNFDPANPVSYTLDFRIE